MNSSQTRPRVKGNRSEIVIEVSGAEQGKPAHAWPMLTNHAHVVVCLAADPDARLRDLAVQIGLTERATHRLVADLVECGIIERARVGRRNHYVVRPDSPLGHPVEAGHTVGDLLAAFPKLGGA